MRVYNLLLLTLVITLSALAASGEAQKPDCTEHINGLSFADPISCSSFYVCLRGRALRRECAHGLYFDPRTQICNLPSLVECRNGDRSSAIVSGHDHEGHLAASSGKAPCETTPKPPCDKPKLTTTPPCEKTPISPPQAETTPCTTTTSTTPCTTTSSTTTTTTTTTTSTTTTTTTTPCTTTPCTTTTTTKHIPTTPCITTTTACKTTTKEPCTSTRPPCTTTVAPCTTTTPPCTTTTTPCTTKKPTNRAEEVVKPIISNSAEALSSVRDCQGLEDGTFFTNTRHCRRFYVCRNNRARHQLCPAGQWFDRELKVCRNRREVTNCAASRN
ncbi:uncharacterized protein Dvir_GJ10070 [Drosophila virilis]|uniref:Chitin-binding type-2 domain-containing protein n=1 Tax=Drosophila virilis TaxID=7244 RepID=A0A0Q9WBD0_DROVI|nr:uncharacterized protein Dvir_GJ10070 [Drosophila virilis]